MGSILGLGQNVIITGHLSITDWAQEIDEIATPLYHEERCREELPSQQALRVGDSAPVFCAHTCAL